MPMRIIKPLDIASTIMSLIDEAEKNVVFVSPYYNLGKWRKFNTVLRRAIDRGIDIVFYVRADDPASIQEVKCLGFEPLTVERLHAKLYFNEREAVITSMNLVQSSDDASLDPRSRQDVKVDIMDWLHTLEDRLEDLFKRKHKIELDGHLLGIRGKNQYQVFIANAKTNTLRLNCVLSEKEFAYLKKTRDGLDIKHMQIDVQEGKNGHYNLLWGTVEGIKSNGLNELTGPEGEVILDIISVFIFETEKMKEIVRNRKSFGGG
jgi:hypothetical protein